MGKHIVYTKITPLPSNVPRQLAVDLLHSHEEVIKMNPLVTAVDAIEPPRDAATDEFYSNWYRITEVITWGFGLKKKIQFQGVFHDQPYGMQSHIYAPLNTDMRQTYRIGGNQPGEPREIKELGVNTPESGLYLREDVNIKVSTPLVGSSVQKEMEKSSKVMIDRIIRKAELLDEGKLHAMFERGKLKTAKPSGEPTFTERPLPSPNSSSPGSPPLSSEAFKHQSFQSPNVDSKGFGRYSDIAPDRSGSVRASSYIPAYQQTGYQGPEYARPGAEMPHQQQTFVSELPGSYYQSNNLQPSPLRPNGAPAQTSFRAEMMGDTTYLTPPQPSESKPSPPSAVHPAYQGSSVQSSPNPSQQADNISRQNSASGYQITNPDQPERASYHSNLEQWQRTVESDAPINDAYYRNSRHSHSGSQQPLEPDHQRFSGLNIQYPAEERRQTIAKCPVCGLFEGDEKAVSHHVSKEHFQ